MKTEGQRLTHTEKEYTRTEGEKDRGRHTQTPSMTHTLHRGAHTPGVTRSTRGVGETETRERDMTLGDERCTRY